MNSTIKSRILGATSLLLLCTMIGLMLIGQSSVPVNAVDDGTCTTFPKNTGPTINNCGPTCEGSCHYSVRDAFNSCDGKDDNHCVCKNGSFNITTWTVTCGPNMEGACFCGTDYVAGTPVPYPYSLC